MSIYLGRNQIAECMRCGQKGLARDLVTDGRNPQLLVFADCWDPPHESERPFTPSNTEGMPRYPIAPELLPDGTPVLAGEVDATPAAWDEPAWDELAWLLEGSWSEGAGAVLTWTRATTPGARFERYEIFRSIDGAEFELRATNVIEYDLYGGVTNTPEMFTNLSPPASATLRYYVEAVTGTGRRVRSNVVTLVTE